MTEFFRSAHEVGGDPEKRDTRSLAQERLRKYLHSPERIADYQQWRSMLGQKGVRGTALRHALEVKIFAGQGAKFADEPRTEAEAFLRALATGQAVDVERFPVAQKLFSGLRAVELSDDRVVDVLAQLYEDPAYVSFTHKAQWLQHDVAGLLDYACWCDVRAQRKKLEDMREEPVPEQLLQEKIQNPKECLPPKSDNTIRPTMDELEKAKEGEPGALFTLRRAFGGYHLDVVADEWDDQLIQFVRSNPPRWQECATVEIGEDVPHRVLTGVVQANGITHLPMSRFGAPGRSSLRGQGLRLVTDEYGIIGVENISSESRPFAVDIVPADRVLTHASTEALDMKQIGWSVQTQTFLDEVRESREDDLTKARRLKDYTKRVLTYSNDSSFNAQYRHVGESSGYCARVEAGGKADCDVANAYFLGLCGAVGIRGAMAAGHYVGNKDKTGASVMSSGTRHAWALVWHEGAWHRMDATPKGDPNMDDDETGEEAETLPDDGNSDGDFAEPEPGEGQLSDEEIDKILQEAQAEIDAKKADLDVQRFTEAVPTCTPEEAKQVLTELERLERLQDSEGNFVLARLRRELGKIVQANMVRRQRIKQPVPLSQADTFDVVPTVIALEAGEHDPHTGSRFEQLVKHERAFSGMDVVFMADKSGSMRDDDGSGVPKAKTQMRLIMILCQAFAEVSNDLKHQGVTLLGGEPMRFGVVSFSDGEGRMELPLSDVWGEAQQYALWKHLQENVGGGTPDHKGLLEAKKMITQARLEDVKPRLTLVLGSTDGTSDDASVTRKAVRDLLKEQVVVECAGVGPGSKNVVQTYTIDEGQHGTHLTTFEELPTWAVERVVREAQKLIPTLQR